MYFNLFNLLQSGGSKGPSKARLIVETPIRKRIIFSNQKLDTIFKSFALKPQQFVLVKMNRDLPSISYKTVYFSDYDSYSPML